MEKLEEIVKFLLAVGKGDGSGNGNGDGNSDGWGNGSGNSDGYSNNWGDGNGSGNSDGSGSGDGSGCGDDWGNGSDCGDGDGCGCGNGSGDGDGCGDGNGWGNGSGWGGGNGSGDKINIEKYGKQDVFYIDGVPTLIDRVKGNIAKGKIIHADDFTTEDCYIVKGNGYFAHGSTLKKALETLRQKVYGNLNFEDKMKAFVAKFEKDKEYSGHDFYAWHNILTGSCELGRNQFVRAHNIILDDMFTVKEFIDRCENAHGGDLIKRLLEFYE